MARRQTYQMLDFIRGFVDLFMVALSWVAAFVLRFHSGLPVPKGIPDWAMYLKLIPFIVVTWFLVFLSTGFYLRSGRHKSIAAEAIDICQNCALAIPAFIAVTYFYNEYRYSRINLALFAAIHPVALVVGRSLIRKGKRFYKRHSSVRKVLLIGSGKTFTHTIDLIHEGKLLLGQVAGVMAVGDIYQVEEAESYCQKQGYRRLAIPGHWAEFFAQNPCDSVVLALPNGSYHFIEQHLDEIANQVTDIKMIPDIARYTRFAASVDIVDQTPVIHIHDSPLQGFGLGLKRLLDIVGASCALILFGPIMIFAACLIRLSSPGPIFYKQERMGVDGRLFAILKFRSMPIAVETATGAVWASKEDNRATSFGKILRRTSLDELPQLFNVLRGDMSLVGPRPERPVFVNDFRKQVPGYMLRHKVKAGMTGWAQINGWRGNTSIERRIEHDLFYIQNWSLWLDIKILFLTAFKGFTSPNAY